MSDKASIEKVKKADEGSPTPAHHEKIDTVEALKSEKSPGIRKIEAIAASFDRNLKILLFVGIFLFMYCVGLDGMTRGVYLATATSSFGTHALLATTNVVLSIVAAATQMGFAKISDVFGRLEMLLIGVFFNVLGTIVEATSNNVQTYAGGVVLGQLGTTAIQLLVTILLSDVTSLQWRLTASFIPAIPFLINTWVSGNVTSSVLTTTTWRWGVGMWAIIMPFACLPIVASLLIAKRRAQREGRLDFLRDAVHKQGAKQTLLDLFWLLDIPGLILFATALSLILIPMTLAAGLDGHRWGEPDIICMLVFGVVTFVIWFFYEGRFARHPAIPLHLFKERTIGAGLAIGALLYISWYCMGDYLYTVLSVGFDETILSATRISSLYSFASVITGLAVGIMIRLVHRIRPFLIAGVIIYTVALGLMIRYRTLGDSSGVIGGQIMLGIGGGLFPYGTQVALQSAVKHEYMAVILSLYYTIYYVGGAIGASVSGAIWTNVLPSRIIRYLADVDPSLAAMAYGSPFEFIALYPVGTPERDAVIHAYSDAQRILLIVGTAVSALMIPLPFLMRNPRLGAEQSLPDAIGAEKPKKRHEEVV